MEIKDKKNDLISKLDSNKQDEKIDSVYKVIGNFGIWQLRFVAYYTIVYIISAVHNTGIVFYSAKSDFWCADLDKNLTKVEKELIINKCIPDCQKYEYDRSMFHTTVITEFDLVCDKAWYVSACASVYQIGYAFSSIIVGYMSDNYGRRLTYKTMMIVEIFSGLGQAFSHNVYFFLVSRFILGIAAYGRFLTGNVLIMETAGPKKRAMLTVVVENGWYFGIAVLITLFYYISNYRYVQLITTGFEILSLVFIGLVPESIRWLLTKGRYDEARKILTEAANMKKKKYEKKELERRIDSLINHFETEKNINKDLDKKGFSILKLWRIPGMFCVCLCFYFLWFSGSLISHATTFNSTDFGDNVYKNIGIFSIASFFANLILTFIISKFKRIKIAKFSFILTFTTLMFLTYSFYQEEFSNNLSSTNINFINKQANISDKNFMIDSNHLTFENSMLKRNVENLGLNLESIIKSRHTKKKISKNNFRFWCGVLLKYSLSFVYHTVYVICVECFPTVIRQFAVGTCSIASRFASVAAPFTKELSNHFGVTFTFSIFTIISFISFVLTFFLPETKDKEIPNTLEDCLKTKLEEKKLKQENKTSLCCV